MRQIIKLVRRTHIESSTYTKKILPLVFVDLDMDNTTERVEIKLYEHMNPETAENFKAVCQGFKNASGDTVSFKGKRFANRTRGYFLETEEIGDTIYGRGFLSESYNVRFDRPFLVGASRFGAQSEEKTGSGFFFTLHEMPGIDNYVAVGEVVSGQEAIARADREGLDVTIRDCGVVGTINA